MAGTLTTVSVSDTVSQQLFSHLFLSLRPLKHDEICKTLNSDTRFSGQSGNRTLLMLRHLSETAEDEVRLQRIC